MNSLKDRILIVMRGAARPLTTKQIARILGVQTQAISSPVAKLVAYGNAEVTKVPDGLGRWHGVYRLKEARDQAYEEWRDQQYGKDCGP